MRIAIPYPAYWPYSQRGVERCMHDFAGYLSRRGHLVHIITTTPGRGREAVDAGARITYLREFAHPLILQYKPMLSIYAACAKMSRMLLTDKPDVMLVWSYSGLATAPLLRRLGIPYLLHFMYPHRPAATVFEAVFARMVRAADVVSAYTPGGAAEVTRTYGVACEVLAAPVDMSFFKPSGQRDPKRPVVLFASDLADPRKGGTMLLKAWEQVHRRNRGARLVLLGASGLAGWSPLDFQRRIHSDLESVRDAAARNAIELHPAGSLESMPALYSEAAVTVLPSYDEAFGMVITESLACGTPVVASTHRGPGEIVTNPAVGATVEIRSADDFSRPETIAKLADAICHGIELSRIRSTVAACRDWASHWSLDVVGARAEALLERATAGQGGVSAAAGKNEMDDLTAIGGRPGGW